MRHSNLCKQVFLFLHYKEANDYIFAFNMCSMKCCFHHAQLTFKISCFSDYTFRPYTAFWPTQSMQDFFLLKKKQNTNLLSREGVNGSPWRWTYFWMDDYRSGPSRRPGQLLPEATLPYESVEMKRASLDMERLKKRGGGILLIVKEQQVQ